MNISHTHTNVEKEENQKGEKRDGTREVSRHLDPQLFQVKR